MVEKKEIIVRCFDGCSCMSVTKWDDETDYFVMFYKNSEKGFWYRLKEAFKYVFLEKDIVGTDLILEEKDYEKLRNF